MSSLMLDDLFHKQLLRDASGQLFMGQLITELSREDLLCAMVISGRHDAAERQRHMEQIEFLSVIEKSRQSIVKRLAKRLGG